MNLIQILIYFLVLLLNVQNIINEKNKLKNCVNQICKEFLIASDDAHLLTLIDRSSVILKAFGSENLINLPDHVYMDDKKQNTRSKIVDDTHTKTLIVLSPMTIYKGVHILRKLKSFNNQEYFRIEGQIIATLKLNQQQKNVYHNRCYSNSWINTQNEPLNENYLIKKQINSLIPGHVLVFATFDDIEYQTAENLLIVQTNGIFKWTSNAENFIWNNLGWSNWGEWSACSKSCNGIQQRHRQCLTNQKNLTAGFNEWNKELCIGYNIEQRECNAFKCEDALNLLVLSDNNMRSNYNGSKKLLAEKIFEDIDKKDFTIMLTIKSRIDNHHLQGIINQYLISIQSMASGKFGKYASLTISIIDRGIRIIQEKNSTSEMFSIRSNLYELKWHQFAFGFRKDGFITCYVDCSWDSSIIMPKGSFELPEPKFLININSKLNDLIEWKQLTLISGNHVRSQCSSIRTPIYDNKRLFEQIFIDETN